MLFDDQPEALAACQALWQAQGYVGLPALFQAAGALPGEGAPDAVARRLCLAFNGAQAAQTLIDKAAQRGDADAANLAAWMGAQDLTARPSRPLAQAQVAELEAQLLKDPQGYVDRADLPYPLSFAERHIGFDPLWTRARLQRGRDRFEAFAGSRRSDTAILVGNGPSLNQIDFDLLRGQDVYISNYAIRHPDLRRLARGVAVSNLLVAEQEPHVFQTTNLWKFHPVWLGHVLGDSAQTVWLNALGGPLFFSPQVRAQIAWHATVTFLWLQLLYSAGYRRVLLIGVDNAYKQAKTAREGDILQQDEDDPNHFDPAYFKGKVWQAADTDHMAASYALAGEYYAADGREIVNCTVGGTLEMFRRMPLQDALNTPSSE